MKQLTALVLAAAIFVPAIATAQIKTIPGDPITVTASVVSVDHATRMMTLRTADGTVTAVTVSPEVKRLNEIKAGDRLVAKYTENIIIRVMKPGEAPVNSATSGLSAGAGARPNATATVQRSLTATITAIDAAVPSITVTGADGKPFTTKVADREALKQVKVGDRLDITWAAAVLLSAETPK